jgi:ATP-binding cassette, subfamily B, bacterial
MRFAWRVLCLLGDRRRLLALAVAAALAHVLLSLVPPLVVRQVIMHLATPGATLTASVGWLAALLAAVALVRAICFYLDVLLHHIAAYGMLASLRVSLYDHVQRLSHAFHGRRQTGALVNSIVSDVDTIEFFVAHSITQVIIGVCVPLGVAVVLVALNWRLAALALLLAPLVVALMILTAARLRGHWRTARRDLSEVNALVQDNLAGLSVIKTFGAEAHRRRLVAERSATFERSVVRAIAHGSWPVATVDLAAGLTSALVLAVGASWVSQGSLALADLFAFLIYMAMLYRPLIELVHANEGIQGAMAAAERVFALLDERPTVADRPGARVPATSDWSIALDGVTFGYEPGRPVLHDVSFRVEPGQLVALVGASGAGKSTCAALVQRWYDPDAGAVRLGGHDPRDLPLDWLRQQVSAVMQDVFLFHGSVRDNLLIGRPARLTWRRPRGRPTPTTSSWPCPRATRRWSASAACASPVARSSACRSPGRC